MQITTLLTEKAQAESFPMVMDVLNSRLSKQDYLEGGFTVSDVAVGSTLLYIPRFFPQV